MKHATEYSPPVRELHATCALQLFSFRDQMACLSLALGGCFGKSNSPVKRSIPGNANKVCTIFGATGAQGGSVARYLAKSGLFAELRLVTRDVSKPSAVAIQKECAAYGIKATLVAADMNNQASMDAALAGATHSFCVTNWCAMRLIRITGTCINSFWCFFWRK